MYKGELIYYLRIHMPAKRIRPQRTTYAATRTILRATERHASNVRWRLCATACNLDRRLQLARAFTSLTAAISSLDGPTDLLAARRMAARMLPACCFYGSCRLTRHIRALLHPPSSVSPRHHSRCHRRAAVGDRLEDPHKIQSGRLRCIRRLRRVDLGRRVDCGGLGETCGGKVRRSEVRGHWRVTG